MSVILRTELNCGASISDIDGRGNDRAADGIEFQVPFQQIHVSRDWLDACDFRVGKPPAEVDRGQSYIRTEIEDRLWWRRQRQVIILMLENFTVDKRVGATIRSQGKAKVTNRWRIPKSDRPLCVAQPFAQFSTINPHQSPGKVHDTSPSAPGRRHIAGEPDWVHAIP